MEAECTRIGLLVIGCILVAGYLALRTDVELHIQHTIFCWDLSWSGSCTLVALAPNSGSGSPSLDANGPLDMGIDQLLGKLCDLIA